MSVTTENTTREILLPVISRRVKPAAAESNEAVKHKRVITVQQKWQFSEIELSFDKQLEYIKQIHAGCIPDDNRRACDTIVKQIQNKLYGYKSQDLAKTKYIDEKFMNVERTIELLVSCENRCFYCNCGVHVLYEYVREPKQWTLERIDNKDGHNIDNVMIACLHCNLHRRTMYHERYLFTKQMDVKKIGGGAS